MIEISGLSKKYDTEYGEVNAVCNVSLNIIDGEFVSIVGRSGSGKSTFLKMISGLLTPTGGNVLIDGVDLYGLKEAERSLFRSSHTGFIFQDYFLEEAFTVYKNIEISLMIACVPAKKRAQAIEGALQKVGLEHKRNAYVRDLSGGEKQRVGIARAIVNEPEYIFADEPCGNLDFDNGLMIMDMLRTLSNQGKTVLLVTHNREDALKSDRIVTLQDGSIIKDEKL